MFVVIRDEDPTGLSGTGIVADGVEFDDGVTVLRWRGDTRSTVVWGSFDEAVRVHGHGGKTRFVELVMGSDGLLSAAPDDNPPDL